MYVNKKNPYAAGLKAAGLQTAKAEEVAPEEKASDVPRDGVLSRVPKLARLKRPPVKLSMAPRYRFALPDPPTDLKMLRGAPQPTTEPARRTSKLELDAKKAITPLLPSFGLRADLVLPGQYLPRSAKMELLPEDEIVLSAIGPRTGPLSAAQEATGTRRALPPPKKAKAATAFPWMRRMAYDEYFSGTSTMRKEKHEQADVSEQKLEKQRRRERLETFRKAKRKPMVHPDKSKSHLRVKSVVPVFRDLNDINLELVSMQFDRHAPLHALTRFSGSDAEDPEEVFRSAVTVAVKDDDNRHFLSCFAPDKESLSMRDNGDDDANGSVEYHERLREFALRETGAVAMNGGGSSSTPGRRMKRAYVMTTVGEGDNATVSLSAVPSQFLLAPRQGVLPPLAHPRLELERNPLTRDLKRRRQDAIVEKLVS